MIKEKNGEKNEARRLKENERYYVFKRDNLSF